LQHASIRLVARALLAVRFLTIVPVSRRRHAGLEDLGGAAPWFPVVGAGLGLALTAIDALTTRVFPPLLAALLTITAWTVLTGGLHLDGLADCLDGLAGHDPAARRAIMSDSRIGAFGAVGLVLFLMLQLAALGELPLTMRWRALVTAPVIARATPAVLGRLFRPARGEGQGALFCTGLGGAAVPAALAVATIVAAGVLGGLGLVALAVGVGAAVVIGAFLSRRLGGVTGDVLGAGVVLTELAVLLTVSAWTHTRP
jgi:adenosylcobinamide-GDP ribazoletransferase